MTPAQRRERELAKLNPRTVDYIADLAERLEEERFVFYRQYGSDCHNPLPFSPGEGRRFTGLLDTLHEARVALRQRSIGADGIPSYATPR